MLDVVTAPITKLNTEHHRARHHLRHRHWHFNYSFEQYVKLFILFFIKNNCFKFFLVLQHKNPSIFLKLFHWQICIYALGHDDFISTI